MNFRVNGRFQIDLARKIELLNPDSKLTRFFDQLSAFESDIQTLVLKAPSCDLAREVLQLQVVTRRGQARGEMLSEPADRNPLWFQRINGHCTTDRQNGHSKHGNQNPGPKMSFFEPHLEFFPKVQMELKMGQSLIRRFSVYHITVRKRRANGADRRRPSNTQAGGIIKGCRQLQASRTQDACVDEEKRFHRPRVRETKL